MAITEPFPEATSCFLIVYYQSDHIFGCINIAQRLLIELVIYLLVYYFFCNDNYFLTDRRYYCLLESFWKDIINIKIYDNWEDKYFFP